MTTGKTIALTIWTLVSKVMSWLFKHCLRFVIAFLPRSNCLLILSLYSPSTMTLELKKRKAFAAFTFSPSTCHEVMGPDAMILVVFFFFFLIFSFKQTFLLFSFTLIKRFFSSSSLSVRVASSTYLRLLIYLLAIFIDLIFYIFIICHSQILPQLCKSSLSVSMCVSAWSCPAVFDPMDCCPPSSLVHRNFQARILEGGAIPYSRGSSQPRYQTCIS